jgi:NADP-reducing hydrogenase subunit HndB
MAKLTISDLKKIKEKQQSTFKLREGGYRAKITVHMGTCGIAAGSRDIMSAIMDEISKAKIDDVITTTKYVDLNDEKIREIFKEHILGGNPVEKYALVVGSETTY